MERTIELPNDQVRELERLAARERRSVDDLVQLAVGDYLVRRTRDWSDWGHRFDALAARVRVPAGVTPDEIEADITLARDQVRRESRRESRGERGAEQDGASGPGGADRAGGR